MLLLAASPAKIVLGAAAGKEVLLQLEASAGQSCSSCTVRVCMVLFSCSR